MANTYPNNFKPASREFISFQGNTNLGAVEFDSHSAKWSHGLQNVMVTFDMDVTCMSSSWNPISSMPDLIANGIIMTISYVCCECNTTYIYAVIESVISGIYLLSSSLPVCWYLQIWLYIVLIFLCRHRISAQLWSRYWDIPSRCIECSWYCDLLGPDSI